MDGKDITPLLKGSNNIGREAMFWYFPHYNFWNSFFVPVAAVREGDWKLIYFMEEEKYELFNLKDDKEENNNLIENFSDKSNKMKTVLKEWMEDVNASEPKKNPYYCE